MSGSIFNPLTQTYDTTDGTKVAAELIDNANCLLDVLYIAHIREKQRVVIRLKDNDPTTE